MRTHTMKFSAPAFGGLLAAALFLVPSSAQAETSVAVSVTTVTASVAGINNMATQVKNVSNNAAAGSIAFGSIVARPPSWSTKSQQYIQVSVDDNAPSWRLRSYTFNFASQPSTTTWGFTYGGLIGTPGAKAPMIWRNSATLIAGGPAISTPTVNGWNFLKDVWDVDDPVTGATNESFAFANSQGYTNIAFGSAAFTRIVTPNVTGGSTALAAVNTPWFYYLEADFGSSPASSYTTFLVMELLNQ